MYNLAIFEYTVYMLYLNYSLNTLFTNESFAVSFAYTILILS